MCIIVAKPAGVPMPGMQTITECFHNNPDGAGIMTADGTGVSIVKGLMTLGEFFAELDALGDLTDRSVVMHFRIATHGGVSPECCHPFPVSEDIADLQMLDTVTQLGIAHNGVIQSMSGYTGAGRSDSMEYVRRVLAPLYQMMPGFMGNRAALKLIENTLGGRLALLEPDGTITTVGDFIQDGGILYSNASYLPQTHLRLGSGWYDTEDDDGYYFGSSLLRDDSVELEDALDFLGMYTVCLSCPLCDDCADFGPYCHEEDEALIEVAERYRDAYGVDLLDDDDDDAAMEAA